MSHNPWAVELQCPQCGAPVTLEEADRILSCAFCRVRLLLIYPTYPCYYLDPYQDRPPLHHFFYIPYWRFKGLALSCLQPTREDRLVDETFLAIENLILPPTLGLQSRAFKLRHLSPQKEGNFLQPRFPFQQFLTQITGEGDLSPEINERSSLFHQIFIGETISLVYAPIYLKKRMVYDGLGNRLLGEARPSDFEPYSFLTREGSKPVEFVPALCPYCGSDLEGEKDTLVLPCRNCDRVWDFSSGGLKKVDFGIIESQKEKTFFIPFWRIKAKIRGLPPQVYVPLTKADYLPGSEPGDGDERVLSFWLPAFKVFPALFLKLSRAMSLRQPSPHLFQERIPKGTYYPVTLDWKQAREGLKAVVAAAIKPRISLKLARLTIEPLDHFLVFIPFRLQGSEFVQEEISVGINKNALHFGRFL